MMTSKEIRESFKTFFASKQHHIVPSAPMVIKDDPTLMFTNAGMNQFKDIILGNAEAQYKRVADSQKCLRVSGKHNDLEEVGRDTYHHTMFEMLGNWSFGDYFKKEAIAWAWEYLTDVLKIDPDLLYVTVFEGYEPENLAPDTEAASLWEAFLPKERILSGNKHDNFWEMGDTGPCGPCSEIHIDLRPESEKKNKPGRELVNSDHPQVIEIWNLVFMQYNRKANGSLEPLPNKVIDTGMGFERLCMAIQGKTSNYDTDIFTPILSAISTLTGISYGKSEETDIAMRVIADHIRTIAFAITDGQLPGNAKAGYVIRRILRRAVRYGYTFLNRREAFMYCLIPVLIETMGEAYPELIHSCELIEKVIKEEEESFMRTLETGIRLLDKKIAEAQEQGVKILNGEDAFILFDTYGFPLDLTSLILNEHDMTVDEAGFEAQMNMQKERARNATSIDASDWVILKNGETQFVGYDKTECNTEILRYRRVKQNKQEFYQIVLSTTPFYAEMGGQVGDTGWLIDSNNKKYAVYDTKKENNLPVHLMKELPAETSGTFVAKIDFEKRLSAEANHTATHLLHEALREVLGSHVEQKGSFVSADVLRFDFSHYSKLSSEEIRKVEILVNERIRKDYKREEFRDIPIQQAKEMGAMALFGEKYGDSVRVLKYGTSIELCGGTHIPSTGMIGVFRIINESSIAAGIRRIEAVTGVQSEAYLYKQADLLNELKELLGNNPMPVKALEKILEEENTLKKQVAEMFKIRTAQIKQSILEQKEEQNGIRLFVIEGEIPADIVKDIAFQVSGEIKGSFCLLGATKDQGRPTLTVMLSKDITEKFNAGNLVRTAAKQIQGGGGGQPHFATAGGKRIEGLPEALKIMKSELGFA
ncbi:alanyl-tRNA synthetase [Porphyromonas macacae]|uniref:Alanine--tRNA ligase n=1 Tax=Porphyromonas macacae TaxID=28115 RepID=A0A0A2E7S4_9PORP|nr:alanine--tRNA ligase [Porphyromonas macacae]KGN74911.1 alanyl-tRNA synthetase [Porphyromonas macacae]